ncbi:uncharacterized protein PHALS_02424 [Plasmopara halstedii]|uniref:Uncharacterized protein n=1 Tax=Plasmopara halstedii TaxID=4781 RepID=A0A0P1A7M1_PLAHL|nr:uncharacterized protein PHALS_02424 [Plasmopara halstedii]CEG36334.1 hypothetical protein PHALS_02424 [Plasmopara halstedii]|eukprot:XP_024572703.1 hypothetical protein PHALS_02424 [Plasmopara halstedii]
MPEAAVILDCRKHPYTLHTIGRFRSSISCGYERLLKVSGRIDHDHWFGNRALYHYAMAP